MLGSNPSADSVASTDRKGMLRHPLFAICSQELPIGRGTKAINPGGAGAKPPRCNPPPLWMRGALISGRPLIMRGVLS